MYSSLYQHKIHKNFISIRFTKTCQPCAFLQNVCMNILIYTYKK